MTENQQLLAEYAGTGSEAAFRELVARYISLVYSTALRLVEGNSASAQDVTQTVFLHLSENARKLGQEALLGGWLHRDTCFVAAKTLRRERRRQAREREAVLMNSLDDHSQANLDQVAPLLDEAINQLGTEDRAAVLLRFFEQRDFRAVGAALGSTEDAARMRVGRALEKLHVLLKHRGVTLSAAALGTVLAGQAVTAAPAGLAACVAGSVMASSAAGGGMAATVFRIMATTKVKLALGTVVAAGIGTTLMLERQAQAKLGEENRALQQQVAQLPQMAEKNQRLSSLVAEANRSAGLESELLRLRSEVSRLRRQQADGENLQAQTARLRSLAGAGDGGSTNENAAFVKAVTFKTAQAAPERFDAFTFFWSYPLVDPDVRVAFVVFKPDGTEYFKSPRFTSNAGGTCRSDFKPGFPGGALDAFFGKPIGIRFQVTQGGLLFDPDGPGELGYHFAFYTNGPGGKIDWQAPFATLAAGKEVQ